MNKELSEELTQLLDKHGVTLQIRQSIVFVPKNTMEEKKEVETPEVEETPAEETPEVAEESAPEEAAE